jgi:hypothetical protein
MHIRVVLHSVLRQRLPSESEGKTELDLPEGSILSDVAMRLQMTDMVYAIGGCVERNWSRPLCDNDEVDVFVRAAGG